MSGQAPEGQTIRRWVVPRLQAAGWSDACWIREFPITNGQFSVVDGRVRRGRPLRADFALLHGEHPIAAVEAKKSLRDVRDGVQQAREYARRLDVSTAYATNGEQIIEIDMRGGTEREVDRFPGPEELWRHHQEGAGLDSDLAVSFFETPYSRRVSDAQGRPKTLRYYQHVAVQRLLRHIAAGRRRLLAVLATGTGKTAAAMQLVYVLWQNFWPRGAADPDDRPRVLYLADRDVLVEQPIRDWFRPVFGDDPMCRVRGGLNRSKHLYFALYQALDQTNDREELFRRFEPDWFDLVIVDECHRGSASASSAWREVLDHFASAVQVGLTATPRYAGDVDTYAYFGAPVYTYRLRDGIEDGFLAPFEVMRVRLDRDVEGVQIPEGTSDRSGQPIPEGTYDLAQFERSLVLPERTQTAARYVTDFLRRTDAMAKTIVFCVDNEHAGRMREALVNLNPDLMRQYGDWAVRITDADGDYGRRLLGDFRLEDRATPVVAVTSRLLSTGVDVPTAQLIVLFRRIGSTVDFKQIIGRGTRLAPEYGKEYFTIIDFTGATQKFDDPDFDGPPVRVVHQEPGEDPPQPPSTLDDEHDEATEKADEAGEGIDETEVGEPEPDYAVVDGGELRTSGEGNDNGDLIDDPDAIDRIGRRASKYVVDGYDVYVASESLYVMDDRGGRLRRVRYEQWVRDQVLAMDTDPSSLRAQWATVAGRKALRELLRETLAFDVDTLAVRLNRVDCDPIDLLIWLAWDLPLLSRRDRVARFAREEREFLDSYSPQARQILTSLLEKYAAHGVDDLAPAALETPPLSDLGSVTELAKVFGGGDELRQTIDELGRRLFAVS